MAEVNIVYSINPSLFVVFSLKNSIAHNILILNVLIRTLRLFILIITHVSHKLSHRGGAWQAYAIRKKIIIIFILLPL